jgi:osmoprotectant transport system substrate-binding protein
MACQGLQAAYGNFDLKELQAVDAGLRYKGLVDGEADVAVAFGTDGEISAFNLVVLEDDQNLFPPYQMAPVVSQAALETRTPASPTALNQLSPLLNDGVMRELNYEVSGNQREPAEVAREFLVNSDCRVAGVSPIPRAPSSLTMFHCGLRACRDQR